MNSKLDVHAIYKVMWSNHIQFSYKGPITQEVLVSLGDTIKEKLHREDCDARVVRRIFSILVETAHNILKYSSEKTSMAVSKKATGVGLIGIGESGENEFLIFSGNIITKEEATRIEDRLKHINSLSRSELQKNYQQQLKEGTISEDGSAGLGLYEVARKSNRPIEYELSPLEDGNAFFELKIYVAVE